MRTRLSVVIVGVGLLLTAMPVVAHHSFAAEYDAQRPVKFTGTVTSMEWINPHAWIHMDIKKPDGKVESWMVEAGAPNALLRRGFNKQSLLAGTVMLGYPATAAALELPPASWSPATRSVIQAGPPVGATSASRWNLSMTASIPSVRAS